MIRFLYRRVVGGLFHVDADFARARLPKGLEPLDFRLDHAVCSVTAFDFVESDAGPYTELALMIYVPPDVRPGRPIPEVGLFPWVLATSTKASRDLAYDRLYMPGYDGDVVTTFERDDDGDTVYVTEGDRPILRMNVARRDVKPHDRLFQAFSAGPNGLYQSPVTMKSRIGEHELELGHIELFDHPLVAGLDDALADDIPFREQVAEGGEQLFDGMEVWR